MRKRDLEIHADLYARVLERQKAVESPNPLVIAVLTMLEHEYREAYQIIPDLED